MNTMEERIFVTGGNGFVGSRLVRLLCDSGYQVRLLLREHSRIDRIEDLAFERCSGDVRDLNSLIEGMRGCTSVLHLAGLSRWDEIQSDEMPRVVVEGTENALVAASRSGVRRFVQCSSIVAVNGTDRAETSNEESIYRPCREAELIYSRSKRDAEAACLRHQSEHLSVMIVNPGEVYGPDDNDLITAGNLLDFARSYPVIVTVGGTCIVHVDDVAEGLLAALLKGRSGRRYILAGANLTLRDLARTTLRILNRRAPVVVIPRAAVIALARAGTHWKVPLPFEPAVAPYAVQYWFASSERARRELGLSFRSAEEILRPTLNWLVEKGHCG